jgi:Tfp pilus assembly protein PilX
VPTFRRIRRIIACRTAAEDGIALVVALAATIVLALAGTSIFFFTGANGRATRLDSAQTAARSVAEAGMQQAVSVLNLPTNNALDSNLLSQRTTVFHEGTATWSGTLYDSLATDPYWIITSTGSVRNPDSGTNVTALMKGKIVVMASRTSPANNVAWNYIYTTKPPTDQCDETIQQSVVVASPLYISGNLCLQNSATIGRGPLDVVGNLTMFQKANGVGSSTAKISDAHIGGLCQWWNKPQQACAVGASDNVWANVLDKNVESVPPPAADWDARYADSSLGPSHPCTTASGPYPIFDNDGVRNNSLATPFNLTPAVSYTCKAVGAELSWDATTKKLTVSGSIYIDGSAYVSNGAMNDYDGQAALYLSGTFLLKNSNLCAVVNAAKTDCAGLSDTPAWDPNTELLGIMANGKGGQVSAEDSEQFVSAKLQGAVFSTHYVDIDTTSNVIGPIFGEVINLGQSVTTSFPRIVILPASFPGLPPVYAQPQPLIYLKG